MAKPQYEAFRDSVTKHKEFPSRLLAIDPGGTTGFSLFLAGNLPLPKHRWQIAGTVPNMQKIIRELEPDVVVAEDFILYGHKSDDLKWDSLRESRLLGAIEATCWDARLPLITYTASVGKRFATNDKLAMWGVAYKHSDRHHTDSIRHGIEYLLFGERSQSIIPLSWCDSVSRQS